MLTELKKFRIGSLADELGIERFVIRFWEKEFNIQPRRSDGGQRFYNGQDLEAFKLIKELLYEKGFTIAGAKKYLKKKNVQSDAIVGSQKASINIANNTLSEHTIKIIHKKMTELHTKLLNFRKLL